jgi:sec-independent protein translocase protein TatA
MLGNLNGVHLLILLVVILLVFGAAKLPALSKSIAESIKIFRQEIKSNKGDSAEKSKPAAEDDKKTNS